jgi:hypothetical protein
MQRLLARLGFVKNILAIAEIAWYNTLMNKQENKAIGEATARAEAALLITEAMERGGTQFLHFLRGWMEAEHYTEMARAAESWIETENYTLPEGN